jgi:hypothetical protein
MRLALMSFVLLSAVEVQGSDPWEQIAALKTTFHKKITALKAQVEQLTLENAELRQKMDLTALGIDAAVGSACASGSVPKRASKTSTLSLDSYSPFDKSADHSEQGWRYMRSKQYTKALRSFRSAHWFNPRNYFTLKRYGIMLSAVPNPDRVEALRVFEQACKLQIDNGRKQPDSQLHAVSTPVKTTKNWESKVTLRVEQCLFRAVPNILHLKDDVRSRAYQLDDRLLCEHTRHDELLWDHLRRDAAHGHSRKSRHSYYFYRHWVSP